MTSKIPNPKIGLREGTFGIATLQNGGRSFPALVRPSGAAIDLSSHFKDTHAIFDDWERNFDKLVTIESKTRSGEVDTAATRFLPPLAHPNVLGAGANSRQHVAEQMTHIPNYPGRPRNAGESDEDFFKRNLAFVDERKKSGMPVFFAVLHSALTGANDDLILPPVGILHDWELELGVVVGQEGRFRTPEQAKQMVAGYVVINDLATNENYSRPDIPWKVDFSPKSQQSFKPCGPFVVPRQFIQLTDDIRITLKVNGQVKQDWRANDMIFSVEEYLSYASERARLTPGDILMMGSPPGNGSYHNQFLKPGDVVESSITNLGSQRNQCVQEVLENASPRWGVLQGWK
jgi:2,4-didehydro-3-deoxy-L-rhamnonate hydrolase